MSQRAAESKKKAKARQSILTVLSTIASQQAKPEPKMNAKTRGVNEFGWSKVKKRRGGGTINKSPKEQASNWIKAQQARPTTQLLMRPSPVQSTKPTVSLECKQAEERARAKVKRMLNDKLTAARVFEQLKIENVALNTATPNARDRARSEPTIIKSLCQQSKRNETKKKRSESNRLLRGAEQQRAAHLLSKYSGLKTEDGKRRQKSNFHSQLHKAN